MPLPNILSGQAKRCRGICRSRGAPCWNPASFGMNFCKFHGARPQNTVRRGPDHPAFKHGQETLEAKAERSQRLAELRELEALSFALGLAVGPKWRGRKAGRLYRSL
jgi:hypothetical protein